jgi:hypothetical protein
MEKYSIFNNFSIICWNILKSTWCTPYSLRAFQWHQEHSKRHHGFKDFNMTNKQNKCSRSTIFHRLMLNDIILLKLARIHNNANYNRTQKISLNVFLKNLMELLTQIKISHIRIFPHTFLMHFFFINQSHIMVLFPKDKLCDPTSINHNAH